MKKWNLSDLKEVNKMGLIELIFTAAHIHTQFHKPGEIQVCQLFSIKTGGCPEDCAYCAQSSRYKTAIKATPLMNIDQLEAQVQEAIHRGATRVCLGAAWRAVKNSPQFDQVLAMIRKIAANGVEVCCTLGMVDEEQAMRLKEAGLYAYNHNLDTSERFYPEIITTRTYQDRLDTLKAARCAGITLCSGGILGMGETEEDRLELLLTLANLDPPPESVPINCLSPIPGTPLEDLPKVTAWEWIRWIALARILMPRSMIRLSAGRIEMSHAEQALAFLAGANSIFAGDKLLTVRNTPYNSDETLFTLLGLQKQKPYRRHE
jgi:biotin synthase